MDIGSGAYTEYTPDGPLGSHLMRRVKNLTDKDSDKRWIQGKVHSHNNMPVFHSVTDMDDLHEVAQGHNWYFSIIVNNRMEWDAKIATVVETSYETGIIRRRDKDGKMVSNQADEVEPIVRKSLLIHPCKVIQQDAHVVPSWFGERANDIIKQNPRKSVRTWGKPVVDKVDFSSWRDKFVDTTPKPYQGYNKEDCLGFTKKLLMADENYSGTLGMALEEVESWIKSVADNSRQEAVIDSVENMFDVIYPAVFGDIDLDEVVIDTVDTCKTLLANYKEKFPITVAAATKGFENYIETIGG